MQLRIDWSLSSSSLSSLFSSALSPSSSLSSLSSSSSCLVVCRHHLILLIGPTVDFKLIRSRFHSAAVSLIHPKCFGLSKKRSWEKKKKIAMDIYKPLQLLAKKYHLVQEGGGGDITPSFPAIEQILCSSPPKCDRHVHSSSWKHDRNIGEEHLHSNMGLRYAKNWYTLQNLISMQKISEFHLQNPTI